MRNNFCEFCGNSLSEGKCNCTEAVENRNKKSSKLKRTIPIAVICTVAIALAAVLIMLLTNASKVDPLEFTEVTFDGYEGNGTVNVEFELDDLIEEIVGEEPDDIDSVEFAKWHNKSEIYEEGIEYKVEPSKGLSNGDTVKVSFIISDMASKKVNATTKEYVVSGLEEVKHIDIFEGINVNFEGISGDGTATIKFSSKSIISDGTGLTLDRSFDLSNGDVVTLKVSDIDY
nr:hypothetical protein [Clostridia bacterium]